MKKQHQLRTLFILFFSGIFFLQASSQGSYVTSDFHQHSTYTDGLYSIGYMMEMNNKFGLDWWANSEHGGAFPYWGKVSGMNFDAMVTWTDAQVELKGKPNDGRMWRWQSLAEWSFKDIIRFRRSYSDKLIIQGYEMNAPGHNHASIAIIGDQFSPQNPNVTALAQFEYLFDDLDLDDSQPLNVKQAKNIVNNHGKSVEAVKWLQDNFPEQSWMIPAHPERFRYNGKTGWNIEHIRDLNNIAPDVFFGFESIPGYQSAPHRGAYGNANELPPLGSYGLDTYGGAGLMSAKVGGLWDALLSEGRKFWLFANSDCHISGASFFPGEYLKNYTFVTRKNDAQAVVDGLRSGNSYVVMGDLIDSLTFRCSNAKMGETLVTKSNEVEIYIKVHDSQKENNNIYGGIKNPSLDHIDLIAGIVGNKIEGPAVIPADGITGYPDEYKTDWVPTTKVIARFGSSSSVVDPNGIVTKTWTDLGNGWREVGLKVKVTQDMYFRLRGTNHGLNTPNETDAYGNPLPDSLMGVNNAEKAFADLWFYSNPIFISVKYGTNTEKIQIEDKDIKVYPNPAKDYLYVAGIPVTEVNIYNLTGSLMEKQQITNNEMNVSRLAPGMYVIRMHSSEGTVFRKIIKE